MNRRQFTKKTLMASACISTGVVKGFTVTYPSASRNIYKGIMWNSNGAGKTILEKFQSAKEAGFDGIEVMSHLDRNEILRARDATGLTIPSVCGEMHWKYLLSDPDPKVRESGTEALKISLEDAGVYGADTVLLVPGRVTENVSYDECWKRSAEAISSVIPLAEKLKVRIAIENVWNNFLLSPVEAAMYIDQFQSRAAAFYFDCGNVITYGWPEQWIKILNKRIAKIHIKEYSRKIAEKEGPSAGFNVKLLEGDNNWPAIMKAVDEIGYAGWATIEQSGGGTPEGLKDLCDRLVKILES